MTGLGINLRTSHSLERNVSAKSLADLFWCFSVVWILRRLLLVCYWFKSPGGVRYGLRSRDGSGVVAILDTSVTHEFWVRSSVGKISASWQVSVTDTSRNKISIGIILMRDTMSESTKIGCYRGVSNFWKWPQMDLVISWAKFALGSSVQRSRNLLKAENTSQALEGLHAQRQEACGETQDVTKFLKST